MLWGTGEANVPRREAPQEQIRKHAAAQAKGRPPSPASHLAQGEGRMRPSRRQLLRKEPADSQKQC